MSVELLKLLHRLQGEDATREVRVDDSSWLFGRLVVEYEIELKSRRGETLVVVGCTLYDGHDNLEGQVGWPLYLGIQYNGAPPSWVPIDSGYLVALQASGLAANSASRATTKAHADCWATV